MGSDMEGRQDVRQRTTVERKKGGHVGETVRGRWLARMERRESENRESAGSARWAPYPGPEG